MFPLHRNQSIDLLKFCLRVGLKYYLNIPLYIMGGGRGLQKDENGCIWGTREISMPCVRKTVILIVWLLLTGILKIDHSRKTQGYCSVVFFSDGCVKWLNNGRVSYKIKQIQIHFQ